MWAGVVFVLLAGMPACRVTAYSAYQYYEEDNKDDDDTDFYDSYDAELNLASEPETTTISEAATRFKRYGDLQTIRTLNPAQIDDIKDALKNIFYGKRIDSLTTRKNEQDGSYTDVYDYIDLLQKANVANFIQNEPNERTQIWKPVQKWTSTKAIQHWSPSDDGQETSNTRPSDEGDGEESPMLTWNMPTKGKTSSPNTVELSSPSSSTMDISGYSDSNQGAIQAVSSTYEYGSKDITNPVETSSATDDTTMTTDASSEYIQEADVQRLITVQEEILNTTDKELMRKGPTTANNRMMAFDGKGNPITTTTTTEKTNITTTANQTRSNQTTANQTTTYLTTTTTPTTTIVIHDRNTTKSPQMDINAIIAIIANLTYDYDWNLTEQFNITLIKYGVPTCPTPTTVTTTTTTPTPPPYDFANTSVVSKCFVCGLRTPEIPRSAHCADAFGGDFLPLVPVDPRARAHIARYRKYCRFLDVHNFVENPSESRSIYGRFTGGCGVRWTDLTGVYTQRTCRNRFKPLMGKHYASKRMAKLELALVHVENGCIISPMATLLPLSRGISLYARFHACVCTGSWCNKAVTIQKWKLYLTILWCWLTNIL